MPEFRIDVRDRGIEEVIAAAVAGDVKLLEALTNVERHDEKAVYLDDTFRVESVESLANGKVLVRYKYQWDAHYGCSDISHSDVEFNEVTAHIENAQLVFNIDLPEPRSTADEL